LNEDLDDDDTPKLGGITKPALFEIRPSGSAVALFDGLFY